MYNSKLCTEIVLRILLFFILIILRNISPYERTIHPEEMWHYMYPRTRSIVSVNHFRIIILSIPSIVIYINYRIFQKDWREFRESLLAFTLALEFCSIVTSFLKAFVGKLRPDFYWRCFPNGFGNRDLICSGKETEVTEGRKSFPSGHTSIGFTSMGFLSLYLCGKFHVFEGEYRHDTWKLIMCIIPLFIATFIGISRIVDYHHDGIDVSVGMLIGITISYLCYRQYFPNLNSHECHIPYPTKEEIKIKLDV